VRAGDNEGHDGDNLLQETILDNQDSRAASLEGGSNLAVDVGDNRANSQSVICQVT
jgi:hypothetical protein